MSNKVVVLTETEFERAKEAFKPDRETFNNNIRHFLKELLSDPVNAEIPKSILMHGITKSKLLEMMIKIGLLEYSEHLEDKNKDGSFKDKATMKIKYKVLDKIPDEQEYRVPKNKFDEKIEKLRIMIFEKNTPEGVNEDMLEEDGGATGCCGITDGSNTIVTPLFSPIRRNLKNE